MRLPWVVIAAVVLVGVVGCKSKGSSGGTAGGVPPPGDPGPPILPIPCIERNINDCPCEELGTCGNGKDPNRSEVPSDDDLVSQDKRFQYPEAKRVELKRILAEAPAAALNTGDLILRDFVNDELSLTEMKKQKLCLWFGNDCLLPKYRDIETKAHRCDLPLAEEVLSYVETTPELRELVDEWVGGSETGRTKGLRVSPKLQTSRGGPLSLVNAAGVSFEVHPLDAAVARGHLVQTDNRLTFAVDGQSFEIFYNQQSASEAVRAQTMIEDHYSKLKDLFENHDVKPYGSYQSAYRFYVVQGTEGNYFTRVIDHVSYIVMVFVPDTGNTLVSFRRRAQTPNSYEEWVRSTTLHELTHAIEAAYMPVGIRDPMEEAMAEAAADYLDPYNTSKYRFLQEYFYTPFFQLPTTFGYRQYGAYIFFSFLRYYYGSPDPIRHYLKGIKGGKFAQALQDALSNKGTEDFHKVFHEFARSNLNLDPAVGKVNYRNADTRFDPLFLSATYNSYDVGDMSYGQGVGEIVKWKVKIQDLVGTSIQYVTSTSLYGTDINRSYKIDASDLVGKGAKVSVVYIDVPEGAGRLLYNVLGKKDLGEGVLNECFTDGAQTPEVILFAISHAGPSPSTKVSGSITMEMEPFCQQGSFRGDRVVRNVMGGETTLTWNLAGDLIFQPGSLKTANVDPFEVEMTGPSDPANTQDLGEILRSLASFATPFVLSGSLNWRIEGSWTETSGECTINSSVAGSGAFPIADGTGRFMLGRADNRFAVGLFFEENVVPLDVSVAVRCSGKDCPPDSCQGRREILFMEPPRFSGRFTFGDTVLNCTEEKKATCTATFNQPVDQKTLPAIDSIQALWDQNIMYYPGMAVEPHLIGLLKAPIIDYYKVIRVGNGSGN